MPLPASRGRILDRNGELMASSVPAPSLWVIPKDFEAQPAARRELASLLGMKPRALEDRIVKTFIARESKAVFDRRAPFAPEVAMRLVALGRVKPGETELRANPRARSAVMRVAEPTDVPAPKAGARR